MLGGGQLISPLNGVNATKNWVIAWIANLGFGHAGNEHVTVGRDTGITPIVAAR